MIQKLVPPLAFLVTAVSTVSAADWPMLGGRPDRNMVAEAATLPDGWSWEEGGAGKNIRWTAPLGHVTYGAPVISDGRVFIGTNLPEEDRRKGGVLKCFSEKDGRLLWEAVHEKLGDATEDDVSIGVCSTPCVEGDTVYYVSNRGELVARAVADGTERWKIDFRETLGVAPNQASASSPLVAGDLIFVLTGHGASPRTGKVANPAVPSFVAVDRRSGRVVWKDSSPGARILTGQWGSPAHGLVKGEPQVVFPGGDGWIYSFEPATGKLLWRFNCKAHEKTHPEGDPETTYNLVSAPVIVGDSVVVAIGEPEAGGGPGALRRIDATGRGDVTATAERWRLGGEAFNDSISTVAVADGLVYATDTAGFLNCVDFATGARVWVHDLKASVWGSPLVSGNRVLVQTADGDVVIFATGREKKQIARHEPLPDCAHGTPVIANGILYLTGQRRLFAVGGK
jgi:outer membrane protein assembly factor BamB